MSIFKRQHTRSIVATDLHIARSERSGPILSSIHNHIYRVDTLLKIWPNGNSKDHKHSLINATNTQTRFCADKQRSQIESCSRLVWRHKLHISSNNLHTGIYKELLRHLRQTQLACATSHTIGICGWSERTNLAIHTPKCLQPLEGLQAIVKAGCRDMYRQILVGSKLRSTPHAILIV